MGRITALTNLKGGTGKSTLAVNLACMLARERASVLLIDADPQGTAAAWLDKDDPAAKPEALDIEMMLPGDDPSDWADRIFARSRHYTRTFVDMPPQMGEAFDACLRFSDALLVPVTPSAIDLRATAKTLKRIAKVRAERDNRPSCMLVPNRIDQRTSVGRALQQALRDLDWSVAPPVMQRSSHATAFSACRWIGAHASGTAAFREVAAVGLAVEKMLVSCQPSDYRYGALAPLPLEQPGAQPMGENGHPHQPAGWLANLMAGLRLLARPPVGGSRA